MALPTTYTESEIKEYMQKVLGDTAEKLGWSVGDDDFDEPAYEVLYIVGEDDFTFIASREVAGKVRSVARVEAWRAAMYYTVHESSFGAGAPGTGQTSRGEIHRHAKEMYELAYAEMIEKYPALAASTSQEVESWPVEYTGDYYANQGD